jgi:mRNA-degrading endonuclease RelE of RelBE toxin-antitoxin system
MFEIRFTAQFEKSFSAIKRKDVRQSVWNKICQLEKRAPIGKKLKGQPYWSIHIGQYRLIYELKGNLVTVAEVLPRKHDYRELDPTGNVKMD